MAGRNLLAALIFGLIFTLTVGAKPPGTPVKPDEECRDPLPTPRSDSPMGGTLAGQSGLAPGKAAMSFFPGRDPERPCQIWFSWHEVGETPTFDLVLPGVAY